MRVYTCPLMVFLSDFCEASKDKMLLCDIFQVVDNQADSVKLNTSKRSQGEIMKVLDLNTTREFTEGAMKRFFLVEDSEFFKIINFNLKAGVTFPVHSHDLDGELSIQVIEGQGFFLGENGAEIPAKTGNILISEIREPHGVRAETDMRIVVTIAPPI